ncbi:serine/threonine protein phosphatase 1 [Kushneria sinocarnis]|uniref:Serine/threonine protein phosphatase 1 n=1 Tax=Kushneria sinocarnis TaxID=595502 RepID=A0A420WYN4_9GAMM|nr:metallophosphoesterase [Kushneria sinocarnis]RKR06255.1 serine/threonine protein phosphatase 1 [Kushneria sinocarnis]
MIERFGQNRIGDDYVVGDIHGHYDVLMTTLEHIGFNRQSDRLFCVGDLIDRGPRSLECLQLVLEPWFFAVRGNHELMAKRALFENEWGMWLHNGGAWSKEHDRVALRTTLAECMMQMPWAMEVALSDGRKAGIVHAEPPEDWAAIEQCDRQALVWSRQRIQAGDTTPVHNITGVVVGHTPVERPRMLGNVRYIDIGVFLSNRLIVERLSDSMDQVVTGSA